MTRFSSQRPATAGLHASVLKKALCQRPVVPTKREDYNWVGKREESFGRGLKLNRLYSNRVPFTCRAEGNLWIGR